MTEQPQKVSPEAASEQAERAEAQRKADQYAALGVELAVLRFQAMAEPAQDDDAPES